MNVTPIAAAEKKDSDIHALRKVTAIFATKEAKAPKKGKPKGKKGGKRWN